jgi:hypothetical protein
MQPSYEVWRNGRKLAAFTVASDATKYAGSIGGETFKVTWERLHATCQ